MPRTVYVAVSECHDSSGVHWRSDYRAALHQFIALKVTVPESEVNLFELEVPDDALSSEITDLADVAAWERNYTPLKSHNRNLSITPLPGE